MLCYSSFVDISQYKDRNPNKYDHDKFTNEEIKKLWTLQDDKYYQIALMFIYSGVRKVPIADKLLPFYQSWYEDCRSFWCNVAHRKSIYTS